MTLNGFDLLFWKLGVISYEFKTLGFNGPYISNKKAKNSLAQKAQLCIIVPVYASCSKRLMDS